MKKYSTIQIITCYLLFVAIFGTVIWLEKINDQVKVLASSQTESWDQEKKFDRVVLEFKKLSAKNRDYKNQGIETNQIDPQISQIKFNLFKRANFTKAQVLIGQADLTLDNLLITKQEKDKQEEEKRLQEEKVRQLAEEEERSKGNLSGVANCDGSPCANVIVDLLDGPNKVASATTEQNGTYLFNIKAGQYRLEANRSKYQPFSKKNIAVVAQQKATVNITLKRVVTQPKAPTQSSTPTKAPTSSTPSVSPPSSPPASVVEPVVSCTSSDQIQKLLCLVNNHRRNNGLGSLSLESSLNTAAAGHSQWMSNTGNFSHTGENNSTPWQRCTAAGTSCDAENIAQTNGGAEKAFDLWKNSEGHNKNMLGNHTVTGFGIVNGYYTNNFR